MKNLKKVLRKKYKSIRFKLKVIYLTRINTILILRNLLTVQDIFSTKKVIAAISIFAIASTWVPALNFVKASNKIVYPIQTMSKLECRFEKFSSLSSDCKMDLPILNTDDYTKYVKLNGGYNNYTRIYTVLWGSTYKYGWDVGNGGHSGTDIATAEGTPVYSIAKGTVINAGYLAGRGNTVSVEHVINGKTIVSNYSHLSKINTSNGKTIKVGAKIGEVGNTGNSFGNHLHFQIDLDTSSHPFYYDYETCPYSYSKITESDVCFNELASNTLDPLVFLETSGAILEKVTYTSSAVKKISSSNTINTNTSTSYSNTTVEVPDILYTYVYRESEKSNIKKLQSVFKEMGLYKGTKTGDYRDIEPTILAYQIDRGVIEDKNSLGAGYFGPKTRSQIQSDYKLYASSGENFDNPIVFKTSTFGSNKTETKVKSTIKIEKISQINLLTREEIEQMEVEEFMGDFDINLDISDGMGNIGIGNTNIIKFTINKKNGRPYKGRTPSDITIDVDETIVKVFPNRLYQFSNGKRDIQLTGLKKGVTTLNVKIGDKILKTFKINVFNENVSIYPNSGSILTSKKIVYGEEKTGFIVMKDENNTNLINLKYKGRFTLTSDTDTKFCIKRSSFSDIKNSLNQTCAASEYKSSISFNYSDTAGGILVYDYKVGNQNPNIKLFNNSDNKVLSEKSILVISPKGLNKEYVYSDEVINLLEKGIVGGISKGYFLEERKLSQLDANGWITNALQELEKNTNSNGKKEQIKQKILNLSSEKSSKYKYLTRREFLEKATTYLVFDSITPEITIKYKDLNSTENKKANLVFDEENTWKDKFGNNYYRPKESITRGEGAYLISRVLEKKTSSFVTLK